MKRIELFIGINKEKLCRKSMRLGYNWLSGACRLFNGRFLIMRRRFAYIRHMSTTPKSEVHFVLTGLRGLVE